MHRIEAAPGPTRQAQVEPCQHGIEKGIAKSRRGPKKQRAFARNRSDALLRPRDLISQRARAEQREVMTMSLAVILDSVAGMHDLTSELGVAAHPLAYAKECGLRAMLIEQRQ